jgi:hypothetical protein
MVRRALTVLVAALVALAAAGCGGVPGLGGDGGSSSEAEALLAQADKALAGVESMSFTMRMSGDVDGQAFAMSMHGGGYVQGERAGDMVFDLAVEGAGVSPVTARMVMRGGRLYLNSGQGWQAMPGVALSPAQLQELNGKWGPLDVAQYVKDVRVEHDTTFLGEPVTKIVGRLEAKDFLKAMFGQLGDSFGAYGLAAPPEDVLASIGDIRFVVYVSDATHLVRAVHESLTLTQQGHEMSLTVDAAVDGVNEPVDIPATGALAA